MSGKPVRSEDIANSANTGAAVIRRLLSLLNEAGLACPLWSRALTLLLSVQI